MLIGGQSEVEIGGFLLKQSVTHRRIFYDLSPRGALYTEKYGGGGWLDSLGSGILVGKDILAFFKNIDLDNS